MHSDTDWSAATLERLTPSELNELYLHSPLLPRPTGVFRGTVLHRLHNRGAQRPLWYWAEKLGFEWLPFGIDFDHDEWFFVHPVVRMGRFRITAGPSRWRDTLSLALHYDVCSLPGFVKNALYDEAKPLSENCILGFGGVNEGVGDGDHFFFALERIG